MSTVTLADLHRELQLFAEDQIRRQLSDVAEALRHGIREDVQRIVSSSKENPVSSVMLSHTAPNPPGGGKFSKSPLMQVVKDSWSSHLPSQVTQMDSGQVSQMDSDAVTLVSYTSDTQEHEKTQTRVTGEGGQEQSPSGYRSQAALPLEFVDTFEGDSGYIAAKDKLSLLRTAVAVDPSMSDELRSFGYFQRCNATHDLRLTPPDLKTAQESMLRVSSKGDHALPTISSDDASRKLKLVHEETSDSIIARFVCSDTFEYCISSLICLNAFFLGMVTQMAASDHDTCASVFIRVTEFVFFIIFITELGMRIFVYRRWFCKFRTPSGTKNSLLLWNVFDSLIVFFQGCEMVLGLIDTCSGRVTFGNVTALRLLRLLRIGRLLRVGKLLRLSESLRVIGTAVFSAGGIFLWSITSLLVITYVFAIYFIEVAMIHLKDDASDAEVEEHFGSLWNSWISLLKAIAGGIDWGDLSTPLARVGYSYALFPFLGYVFFTLIVLMNVFTGLFLESCSDRAKEEKEIQLLRNAYATFKLSDYDDNNTITKEAFEASLKHRSVQRFFDAIDLQIEQAEVLFELLDTSHDGLISCDEFLRGCLRLRGSAKALDLLVLSREVNQLFDGLATATKHNASLLKRAGVKIDQHILASEDNFRSLHHRLGLIL